MPTIWYATSDRHVAFDDGDDVNLLRLAIRHECGVPYKCASGNCGTDRVHVESGAENLSPVRRKERERLGEEELADGYRLACQTYASGDVTLTWDPDRTPEVAARAQERLRARWLAEEDTA